jgi:hypothetical protein
MYPSLELARRIKPYSCGAKVTLLTEFLCSLYSKTFSHWFCFASLKMLTLLSIPPVAMRLPYLGWDHETDQIEPEWLIMSEDLTRSLFLSALTDDCRKFRIN